MSPSSPPDCASVFCVPFFRYIYCFFTPFLFFIKALPFHLSLLILSSSSGQNRTDIFHISVPVLLHYLTKSSICSRDYLFRRKIFLSDKYFILLLSRYPSFLWSLVLLQGLVGMYSAWLPFGMMSFRFGCMSCERKEKKTKKQRESTVSKNMK